MSNLGEVLIMGGGGNEVFTVWTPSQPGSLKTALWVSRHINAPGDNMIVDLVYDMYDREYYLFSQRSGEDQ